MLPRHRLSVRPAVHRVHGFALFVTLGLLALLGLLLFALAMFTQIETANARVGLQQEQARQNARMALDIALGRLQRYAGPDARVTAIAAAFGGGNGSRYHTGVWDAGSAGATPLTWLISGNEGAEPLAMTPGANVDAVELAGVNTCGVQNDVAAPTQSIVRNDLPGQDRPAVVGHYAWWVGDEGVKAPVALADPTDALVYPPFDTIELRRRIRQQMALGAAPMDATGTSIFEPRDAVNAPFTPRVLTTEQLALLHQEDGLTPVGSAAVRQNFQHWATDNQAVLASTTGSGLRQDLSLNPALLGAAFASWANFGAYIEDPANPAVPAISPSYPTPNPREAMRRRYRMTPPQSDLGIATSIAPVLSYFLITFNVRTDQSVAGAIRPLEVRARWMTTFWNPYTSALIPEQLQLEVSGLPVTQVVNDSAGVTVASISLDGLYGSPLRIALPWQAAGRDDQQSWLPGRVYTWSAQEDLNKAAPPPPAGFASVFYTRSLNAAAGQGVQRAVSSASMSNSAQAHLAGGPAQLTLRLYRPLPGGGRELLRTHLSPSFNAFVTTPAAASAATYQFSYVLHLAESTDTPASPDTWLSTPGQDPREAVVPAGSFLSGPNGPRPELYPNYTSIAFPDRLLDRALPASAASTTGQSYNEDTPLFELPRGPLLSVGGLQHLIVTGGRPFTIGNSWGQSGRWNQLFDRYFFSGLAEGVGPPDLATQQPWPNPLLRTLSRRGDGAALTMADIAAQETNGYSSKYLLQRGAFNVNSVDPTAWLGVLRAGRYVTGANFEYLAATAATGTQADAPPNGTALGNAVFFRFPISAQETFQADAGYAASSTVPPAAPNAVSSANTHLFRRGVRVLSDAQAKTLSEAIAVLVREKLADSGPFRSLEEFLNPSSLFGGMSLLEKAIADAVTPDGLHLNDPTLVAEFSSQWLTQADMLSLLAPVLFTRSDTFRIRAYGDAVNSATATVDAAAWCEAIVQRTPEYCDPSQPPETAPGELNIINQRYGRRFRVVSFRWLRSTDI